LVIGINQKKEGRERVQDAPARWEPWRFRRSIMHRTEECSSAQVEDYADLWDCLVSEEDRAWWGQETFWLDDDVADIVPGEPSLPFSEWIAAHAAYLRSLEGEAYHWLAGKIDELAELARFHRAICPDCFDARDDLQQLWVAESQGGGQ
jgi:hypothetical protein